jgi:hypothetical protein
MYQLVHTRRAFTGIKSIKSYIIYIGDGALCDHAGLS